MRTSNRRRWAAKSHSGSVMPESVAAARGARDPTYPRRMSRPAAEFADHHGDHHEGDHHHRDVSGGALRAATFGAMDGLVTNIALIAGVGGGGADRNMIILTGMAGLVAGAFSMALGEYASVQTQNDAVRHEVEVERAEIRRHPLAEQTELAQMYED